MTLIMIEKGSNYARLGRQLRAQVTAAMQYDARVTETHDRLPLVRHRS